jgi:AcrR family transcriptional regulator
MFEVLPDSGLEPGRSADPSVHQPVRRHLSERQAELAERLVLAAADEAMERPYAEISVRTIAKRAGVATATAYTYFSSKDHLLAEVMWLRLAASPHVVDLDLPLADRVTEAVRSMSFGAQENPDVVRAGTTALLADGPDVMAVRSRIGLEMAHRLKDSLGPEADPAVLRVLQITYTGGLLSAGLGHLEFGSLAGLMAEAAGLLSGGAS